MKRASNWLADAGAPRRRLIAAAAVALAGVLIFALSGAIDLFETFYDLTRKYEDYELDEIATVAVFSPALLLLYFVIDVAGERRTERTNRQLCAGILSGTPHSVAITDAAGNLLYMNAAGYRLHGFEDADDLTGQSYLELFSEDAREDLVYQALPRAQEDGAWDGYSTRLTASRQEVPTSEVIICHRDRAGRIANFSFLGRDLSERVAYEDRLRQKQRLESVGHLAGGVAHQFNNLLMIIIGYTNRAKKAKEIEAAQASLEQVLKAANTASGMTRELLIFSRRDGSDKQVFSVSEAVDSMMTLFRPLVGELCRLDCRINHDDTWVEADPENLNHAIMNMVTNARDAMPDGGLIQVSVDWYTGDRHHHPTFGTMTDQIYVMISVRDEGQGMTKETLDRIFEPFFTTKAVGKGTGLGLPVVLGFVEASEGALDVESEPGRGTAFKLYLPAAQRVIETNDVDDEVASAPEGATILLVDDQDELRSLLRESLTEMGFNVLTAGDGQTAVEIEQSYGEKIDLLLTDIIMPRMNGIDLAAELTKQDPSLNVVFMTGYPGQAGDKTLTPPDGAIVLQKPVANELLVQTLTRALRTPGDRSNVTSIADHAGAATDPAAV